jgi:hypothetical protein
MMATLITAGESKTPAVAAALAIEYRRTVNCPTHQALFHQCIWRLSGIQKIFR